jgi:hypothetical protein
MIISCVAHVIYIPEYIFGPDGSGLHCILYLVPDIMGTESTSSLCVAMHLSAHSLDSHEHCGNILEQYHIADGQYVHTHHCVNASLLLYMALLDICNQFLKNIKAHATEKALPR